MRAREPAACAGALSPRNTKLSSALRSTTMFGSYTCSMIKTTTTRFVLEDEGILRRTVQKFSDACSINHRSDVAGASPAQVFSGDLRRMDHCRCIRQVTVFHRFKNPYAGQTLQNDSTRMSLLDCDVSLMTHEALRARHALGRIEVSRYQLEDRRHHLYSLVSWFRRIAPIA